MARLLHEANWKGRSTRNNASSKTGQTLALFIALTMIPYLVPGLRRYRIFLPSIRGTLSGDQTEGRNQSPQPATEALAGPSSQGLAAIAAQFAGQIAQTPGEIEDPSGHSLDHFFDALGRAEARQAIARVCHYGD